MRRLLRAALVAHGYSLVEASTGRDGVASALAPSAPTSFSSISACPTPTESRIARRIREFTPLRSS